MYAAVGADSGAEVVAYWWSGMMSSFAYFVARYLDLDVKLYDGSYIDWTKRGLPLEP